MQIPSRMRHLPTDRRGFVIPWTVVIDVDGKPHFTINNDALTLRCLTEDLCAICGSKLFVGRWFTGGPLSAFHEHGAYNDPPTHHECAEYALKVCPYLAAPRYAGRIDGRTNPNFGGGTALLVDNTMLPDRPEIFVSVMAKAQDLITTDRWGLLRVRPRRPYSRVEFWRGGEKLTTAEGQAIVDRIVAEAL